MESLVIARILDVEVVGEVLSGKLDFI